MGIALAALVESMPQFALLLVLTLLPMRLLSGAATPRESMPEHHARRVRHLLRHAGAGDRVPAPASTSSGPNTSPFSASERRSVRLRALALPQGSPMTCRPQQQRAFER